MEDETTKKLDVVADNWDDDDTITDLGLYALGGDDGHTPVAVTELQSWGEMFSIANRRVKRDVFANPEIADSNVVVSTVFLAIDHNFSGEGAPVLFETMVFGGSLNNYQSRSRSWDEAVAAHYQTVLRVLSTDATLREVSEEEAAKAEAAL